MIAGETEYLLDQQFQEDSYDDFFRSKAERAKRKAARKARRLTRRSIRIAKREDKRAKRIANRQNGKGTLFSKLGNVYQDLGGGAAIGSAVDTILSKPVPIPDMDSQTPEKDKEYSFGLQAKDANTASGSSEKKKTNYTPIIIGGVAFTLVVIAGVVLYTNNQKEYVHITKS